MKDDANLNYILNKRDTALPRSNLSRCIIEAARPLKPKYATNVFDDIYQEIMAMILLPRPAYALAICLFFGLILGLQLNIDTATIDQDWFSFADITQEGDWL